MTYLVHFLCRPSTPVPSTPVKAVAAALWQSQQARDAIVTPLEG